MNDVDFHRVEPIILSASSDKQIYLGEFDDEQIKVFSNFQCSSYSIFFNILRPQIMTWDIIIANSKSVPPHL